MTNTWIEGEGDNGPLFKIEWWNHWNHLELRTNNTNEAYNFRLVVKMGSQIHPNIWLWVESKKKTFNYQSSMNKFKKTPTRNRTNEIRKDNQILIDNRISKAIKIVKQ